MFMNDIVKAQALAATEIFDAESISVFKTHGDLLGVEQCGASNAPPNPSYLRGEDDQASLLDGLLSATTAEYVAKHEEFAATINAVGPQSLLSTAPKFGVIFKNLTVADAYVRANHHPVNNVPGTASAPVYI